MRPSRRSPSSLPVASTMRISWPGRGWPQATKRRVRPPGWAGSARPERTNMSRSIAVDERAPAQRREGQPDRGLGQPVHRRHRLPPETVGGEALGEPLDRRRAHRLGAVEGQPPRAQVEPLELRVVDLGQAELVGEVRAGRDRAPVGVDRPEPSRRAGQEHLRAHHHQRDAEIQAAQPRADQTHVVIQRQPTDERVRPGHRRGLAHRPDVGEQVGVRERDPFGLAGAARGVLHQREVVVTRPGKGSGTASVAPVRDSGTTTWRRLSTFARSRWPRVTASGTVTSIVAPAFARMPAVRRRWSASWEGRAGG